MNKQIKAEKFSLPHANAAEGTILTATSEQLRQFVLKHAGDTEAFSLKFELTKVN